MLTNLYSKAEVDVSYRQSHTLEEKRPALLEPLYPALYAYFENRNMALHLEAEPHYYFMSRWVYFTATKIVYITPHAVVQT